MSGQVIEDADKAVRLARAVASDIGLYNADKIKEGIEQDTFFEICKAELDEGKALYKSRVSHNLDNTGQLFDEAVVNVILHSKGHVKSPLW